MEIAGFGSRLPFANDYMVPPVGLEPTRSREHRILSPARLPIPPQGHCGQGMADSGGGRGLQCFIAL
jgi:hypothetical protein